MSELIALFATSQIQWILILIAIDVVLGVIGALVKKNFRLGKLANFMVKPVLGYIFGFAVLEMVAQALPSFAWMVGVAFVLVVLALVGSILNNLGKMGLPLPAWLKKE
jgi:phage-related holin